MSQHVPLPSALFSAGCQLMAKQSYRSPPSAHIGHSPDCSAALSQSLMLNIYVGLGCRALGNLRNAQSMCRVPALRSLTVTYVYRTRYSVPKLINVYDSLQLQTK